MFASSVFEKKVSYLPSQLTFSSLKMDGWKTFSFPFGMAQPGRCELLVSGRVGLKNNNAGSSNHTVTWSLSPVHITPNHSTNLPNDRRPETGCTRDAKIHSLGIFWGNSGLRAEFKSSVSDVSDVKKPPRCIEDRNLGWSSPRHETS